MKSKRYLGDHASAGLFAVKHIKTRLGGIATDHHLLNSLLLMCWGNIGRY